MLWQAGFVSVRLGIAWSELVRFGWAGMAGYVKSRSGRYGGLRPGGVW